MRRLLFAAPLMVLLALGVLFAGYALTNDPRVQPSALIGQPLPALTLASLDGGPERPLRGELRGATVVNVFASWCGPCEIEHPQLVALREAGVPVVGLAHRDDPANTRAFLQRLGDPFRAVLLDRDGRAGVELGVSGVPETFLVGADGVVLEKVSGPLTDRSRARLLATARRNATLASRQP